MSWAAANFPNAHRQKQAQQDAGEDQLEGTSSTARDNRRSMETVEAALARLSRSYMAAMECIGALSKTSSMIQKNPSHSTDESLVLMKRVANAARSTLEKAVLCDPLIIIHIPTLFNTMLEFSTRKEGERWQFVKEKRPIPPVLSSAAHKSTVRELAYLSLVNYSDLLQSCSKDDSVRHHQNTVLDRGVVCKVKSLHDSNHICWTGETTEEIQRLAVTALCDASSLDGSDPTVWLKLACASRTLEHVVLKGHPSNIRRSKHRLLQRYALEQGSQALPPHVPPNRAVQRALQELQSETEPEIYESILMPQTEPTKLVLELPRYSWSTLGRMLLRACREGANFQVDYRHHAPSLNGTRSTKALPLGSPCIVMNLSPLLALPNHVLGKICLYLENRSIWRFEATCRALSVAIISARALTEQEKTTLDYKSSESPTREENQLQEERSRGATKQTEDEISTKAVKLTSSSVPSEPKLSREFHRSSQRLRSQQITSGKKAERSSKRHSFEYCFLATIGPTTIDEHKSNIDALKKDDKTHRVGPGTATSRLLPLRTEMSSVHDAKRREAQERIGDASLTSFAESWSGRNSGPMDLMLKFLSHVAMHTEDVFASDPSGAVALTSCVISCFELETRRNRSQLQVSRMHYESPNITKHFSSSLDKFAVDVLHAELLLKQCDRFTPGHIEFDDDSNKIALMVPTLFAACEELGNTLEESENNVDMALRKRFLLLKIRCYWLLAGFYLWRRRFSPSVWEAREAEEEGMAFIEEASKVFLSTILKDMQTLKTPHLLSPSRTEQHWKELSPASLIKYRDEIQASAVVSRVRQKFQVILASLDVQPTGVHEASTISRKDAVALYGIGKILLDRYNAEYDDIEAKYTELVEDFLAHHGEKLVSSDFDRGKLFSLIPLDQVSIEFLIEVSNPSILTMLVLCLTMKESNHFSIFLLLARLVLSTRDLHSSLLQRIEHSKRSIPGEDDDNFLDSDDSVSSEDTSEGRKTSNAGADEKRVGQCGRLMTLLFERLCKCTSYLSNEDKCRFRAKPEFHLLIQGSIEFSSSWYVTSARYSVQDDDSDRSIFRLVLELVRHLLDGTSDDEHRIFDSYLFHFLSRTLVDQRHLMEGLLRNHGDRSTRMSKQKLCVQRTEYLGLVACETGYLLSKYLARVENHTLIKSILLQTSLQLDTFSIKAEMSIKAWNDFVDAVLWLWKFSSQNAVENPIPGSTVVVCSSFDRPIVQALRVPVATLVVGLCGTASSSRPLPCTSEHDVMDDTFCLTEFFDSDESVNDWSSDDEESPIVNELKKKELLRVICHAIQCISLVIRTIDDKMALCFPVDCVSTSLGPPFPLVTTRVLNFFADTILQNFVDTNLAIDDHLWSEHYAFNTRTIGELLDSMLHKTYRWLYGFALVSEKSHLQSSSGKELSLSITPTSDLAVQICQLENTKAAAQLYRCIVRAYAGGRRSPPKSALELVSASLPQLEESEGSKALRSFLFDPEQRDLTLTELKRLLSKEPNWDQPFLSVRKYLFQMETMLISTRENDEVMRVRKGILAALASGALPMSATESGKTKSDSSDDDRLSTAKTEEILAKKFEAILEDLCLGAMNDIEGWYRAAQCVNMKAELIADRLGLSKGFSRNTNFAIPTPRPNSVQLVPLEDLEKIQAEHDLANTSNCTQQLGDDLSIYVRSSWSAFSSLRACSAIIGKNLVTPHTSGFTQVQNPDEIVVWKQLEALYQRGDYVAWQEGWGGMFVCALRKLAIRLESVALYVLQSKAKKSMEDKVLFSELSESLGIIFYSALMGSQSYGYPMHVMALKRKRDLAVLARVCFAAAANVAQEPVGDDGSCGEDHATWDLDFMVGKCDEKIASTYKNEEFHEAGLPRMYEKYIQSAMDRYSSAYAQAKVIEQDGGFIVEQSGGSAHGSPEVLYRLLATRLKCLINAISMGPAHLRMAEEEALRLTEQHWHKKPVDEALLKEQHTRDRIWNVLVDVVAGLAQCRVDNSYFHRSVFRHAQALMWSPILYNPTGNEDSLSSVPATRSFQIRGLNNSTPAAQSAEVAMSTLFDKKRSQLCAVWVTTTPSSSPFQLLNNSTRKYDSLRGKYIAAYIETLRLCRRRVAVETFLKWTWTCRRDLPSYYQASAQSKGLSPARFHTYDRLLAIDPTSLMDNGFLITAKRQANSAFADILTHEIEDRARRTLTVDPKVAESFMKHAYAAYLRLNCSKEELVKTRAWKYGSDPIREVDAMCQAYLAFGDKTETLSVATSDFGEWSGTARKSAIFSAALAKYKSMFPSLSGTFFSKKASSKAKRKADDSSDTAPDGGAERKGLAGLAEETTTVSYEVTVPSEVSAGGSFFTTVKVGNGTKKLKLTVPESNPSTLRFTLQVPMGEVPDPGAKKDQEEDLSAPEGTD